MRVVVDEVKCVTAGFCVKDCPEVFRFREGSKKATAVRPVVPRGFEDKCLAVARACPSGAIRVVPD